jgi:hypothetical protein
VLSLLSFSNTQISKEINPSSFLLQMENLDALMAILHSSNLLLNPLGCSATLRRSFSLDSSSKIQNSKSSLLVPVCTLSQCPPSRVFLHRTPNSLVLFCAPNAPNQCPPGKSSTELIRVYVCKYVSSYTALPLEVFNNLTSLSSELLISTSVPTWHTSV